MRALHWLSAIGLIVGATLAVRAERLPVKTYTTTDGLAHNSVERIVRDSRGFLWFCTFEGLSRFDGYGFTTYGVDQGLPSPVVHDLLETRTGEYWVGTGGGLCRFDPRGIAQPHAAKGAQQSTSSNAMFSVYVPGEDADSRSVTSLFEDRNGVIWCGTARGLYRLEKSNGEAVFRLVELGILTQVTSIIEDRHGALWIGSINGVYRLVPEGSAESYRTSNGLPNDHIHSLLEDREGRIWVATRASGLCRLVSDPEATRPVVARFYTAKDGLPARWINQIFQASDGSLWAGSNEGLIRFVSDGGGDFRFRVYSEPHGLSFHEVESLAEDRNQNLWLGIAGSGGTVKLARSGFTAFAQADGFRGSEAAARQLD